MCLNHTRDSSLSDDRGVNTTKSNVSDPTGRHRKASTAFGLTSTDYKQRFSQTMCPVLRCVYLVLALLLTVPESLDAFTIQARDSRGDNLTLTLHPSNVSNLLYGQSVNVSLSYYYTGTHNIGLKLTSQDTNIAESDGKIYTIRPRSSDSQNVTLRRDNQDFFNQSVRIDGVFLGRTYLEFFTNVSLLNATSSHPSPRQRPIKSKNWYHVPGAKYPVIVIRKNGPLNHVFTTIIIILVVLANIAMGCKVDLNVVKETMKRPIAPCIGLFSQFIIMPILGFAVSQMFDFEPIIAFALLATGCAPGGGASNTYTFLAGGNVSLSVTMTLISTLASLAMIPLWLFTLGSLYVYRDATFAIPYQNIIFGLVGLIVPVLIGLLIQRKRPAWIRKILSAILPLMIFLIVLILSVGIYANLYVFHVFHPKIIIASALLPNAGFLLGGLLAMVFMQSWTDVKTIAIETGLQNTGVPIILLLSLPKPESDLAIVAPIASALFTPVILWIFISMRMVYNRYCSDRKLGDGDRTVKCRHTELEDDAFIDNIPCRRTEKTPAPCPMNFGHETLTEKPGMPNGTVGYIDEAGDKAPGHPVANGYIDHADESLIRGQEPDGHPVANGDYYFKPGSKPTVARV